MPKPGGRNTGTTPISAPRRLKKNSPGLKIDVRILPPHADIYNVPPLASKFLTPPTPIVRWLTTLTAANVVGLRTVSGPAGTMGSDKAPSGEGGQRMDIYG